MKMYRGIYGCIDPRLLDLSTSWRWMVSFTSRSLYPRGKSPQWPLDRRLGGPQSRSRGSNLARNILISVDPRKGCVVERNEWGGREVIWMLVEEGGNCFFGNASDLTSEGTSAFKRGVMLYYSCTSICEKIQYRNETYVIRKEVRK
jgi:hypothetical protein